MSRPPASGRTNQKLRTRKALLQAASRLMREGRKPSLEEVAEAALVSRATAYRYFPTVEALLLEAALDVAAPEPEDLFDKDAPSDPVGRVLRVERALHDMIAANETPLRLMLAESLERTVSQEDEAALPARQNRRTALIEAALGPCRREFSPSALDRLTRILAVIIGTESMVVFKDVLGLDEAEARKVRRWAIEALIEAARRPG